MLPPVGIHYLTSLPLSDKSFLSFFQTGLSCILQQNFHMIATVLITPVCFLVLTPHYLTVITECSTLTDSSHTDLQGCSITVNILV